VLDDDDRRGVRDQPPWLTKEDESWQRASAPDALR
jgi:hypothetical protein